MVGGEVGFGVDARNDFGGNAQFGGICLTTGGAEASPPGRTACAPPMKGGDLVDEEKALRSGFVGEVE